LNPNTLEIRHLYTDDAEYLVQQLTEENEAVN
jgi:hypothetical protein